MSKIKMINTSCDQTTIDFSLPYHMKIKGATSAILSFCTYKHTARLHLAYCV